MTIGDQGTVEERTAAGQEVARLLPVRVRATEVWLMAGSTTTSWERLAEFPLGD